MATTFNTKHVQVLSRRSKIIGNLVHRDVDAMSEQDYRELESSLELIQEQLGCKLNETREMFLDQYSSQALCLHKFGNPLDAVWGHREFYAILESRERGISVQNTVNYIYSTWLQDRDDEEALKLDPGLERYFRMKYSQSPERTIIEGLIGRDFKDMLPTRIRSIFESLKRLTYKYECPLGSLKDAVLDSFDSELLHSREALSDLIKQIRDVQAPAEAQRFKIAITDTGQWLISKWLDDCLYQLYEEERVMNNIHDFAASQGIPWSNVEQTVKGSKLVPDLSKNNNLENKLFRLAKELANYIGYYYKGFPPLGYYEALVYCSILLVSFRSDFDNEIDLDVVSDCLFVLLYEEIRYKAGVDDFIEYFNQRVVQWGKDEGRMAQDPEWKPVSLYAAFYIDPFSDVDNYSTMQIPADAEIDRFKAVLRAMKTQLVWKHSDWNNDIKVLGEEIRSKVEELKNKGLTPLAITQMIGPLESEPYGITIDENLRIWLDNQEHSEIVLSPIHKAVYLLFLKHPEGIRFKDFDRHREELEGYYTRVTHRNDIDEIHATIDRLISPYNNSLNEKCARIKGILGSILPEDLIEYYSIEGARGEVKTISLPRNKIIW